MDVLEEPVLVLNSNWQWIGMATARVAMTKLCGADENGDKANIVDGDYIQHDLVSWMAQPITDLFIQTGRTRIAVPEVILVTRYGHVPKQSVKWSRIRVLKRDRFTCQYCNVQPGMSQLTVDHVLPKSRNGKTNWENCVAACYDCNAKKADRTPSEAGMKLKKAPGAPFADLIAKAREGKIKEAWKPYLKIA